MKPGFAARKAKSKANKAKKAKRKQQQQTNKHNGDAEMADVQGADSSDDGIDYTMHPTDEQPAGKPSHKAKVQLKRALKVKVAQLKDRRAKLTKLPGNKAARKQLNENIRETVEEVQQLSSKAAGGGKKKGGKGKAGRKHAQAAAGAADGETMAE